MADPNIQTLIYPISVSPGIIKTYQTEVNKQTGNSVTYDVTNLGQKDAVWRSDREVDPTSGKIFYRANPVLSSYYEKLSDAEKNFIQIDVAYQSDNQRAAFINKNYTQTQKNNLFAGMPKVQNTAPPVSSSPVSSSGGSSPTPPVTKPFNLGGGLSKASKSRNTYGKYHYPTALEKTTQDRIKFSMKPVIGGTINPKLGEKTFTKRYGGSIGEVTLPIQPNIMDSNTVDWSGTSMNALLGYGAAQSMSLASSKDPQEFLNKAGQSITDIVKALKDPKYQTLTNIALAQEAVGLQGLLSRATGAALNPNLELLFNGPQLRSFDFSFTMSPRSSKEATQVRNIIRFFKQGMSVKTTDSNVFLKSPHVFDIRYITYDGKGKQIDHPSINRIKTCALIGCDVNYTPDGNYMTYNEPGVNPMTSYQMTLRFSEIDPIYDEDYSYTDSEGKTTNQYNIGINDIGF